MSLRKRDSVTANILLFLGETSYDLLRLGIDIAVHPHEFLRARGFPKERITRYIADFQRSKYVQKKGGQYMLTSMGRSEAIKLLVQNKYSQIAKTWQGKWLVVIFDIPEANRRQRNLLRNELRMLGFLEVQKSVWVTPLDIKSELLCLLELWNVEIQGANIRIIVTESLHQDDDLKKQFGLT